MFFSSGVGCDKIFKTSLKVFLFHIYKKRGQLVTKIKSALSKCLKTFRRQKLKVTVLKILLLPFWGHNSENTFKNLRFTCGIFVFISLLLHKDSKFYRSTKHMTHIFALKCC